MDEGSPQEVGTLHKGVRTVGEPSDGRRTGGMGNLEETRGRIIP